MKTAFRTYHLQATNSLHVTVENEDSRIIRKPETFSGSVSLKKYLLRVTGLVIIFFVLSIDKMQGQQNINYALHANIIYHFTKYIDWPLNEKSGDFIIGIVGDTPLFEELKKNIANKMVGNQKIVIKRFSSSASTFNCHILFISDDERSWMKKIVSRTAGTPTLLVTESEGFAQKGACINFSIVSDHLKLEINKNNIEQRDLSIASDLLQLGKVVK